MSQPSLFAAIEPPDVVRARERFSTLVFMPSPCFIRWSRVKASFNQQIAQYRGKVPEQQLTDLAVGQFEESLAKTQEQVWMSYSSNCKW